MAIVSEKTTILLSLTFTIDENEARGLDALVGYGDDAFIAAFKEKLGNSYLENHEAGLRKFFRDIRAQVPPVLSRINDARKAFAGKA